MDLAKTILRLVLEVAERLLTMLHIFNNDPGKKEVAEALKATIDLSQAALDGKLTRSVVLKAQKRSE